MQKAVLPHSLAHLHGGHARVVPALHDPLLHKPRQLALGQHGVHKGQPAPGGIGGWGWGMGVSTGLGQGKSMQGWQGKGKGWQGKGRGVHE